MSKLYARLAPSDYYVDIDVYLDFENESKEGYLNVPLHFRINQISSIKRKETDK